MAIDALLHPTMGPEDLHEPRWARFLFASRVAAWLWLIVRLYMASVWLPAGYEKITSGKWVFGDGTPIVGFLTKAVSDPGTPSWYASFINSVVLPNASLFATLVALGEFAVGLGLLFGLLTGFAAFFAVFMSANYVLSGTLSSNPVQIVLGLFLVVAWRNAGWIGLDRFFLPWAARRFRREPPQTT